MVPFAPNPKTGFLESNAGVSFNSILKVRFLQLAREAVNAKSMPNIPAICKALDIHTRTFYAHKSIDDAFRIAWDEVLDECEATLVDTMYTNGQRPSGYMDRITWLRAYKPGRWNPDLKLNISHDSAQLKDSLTAAASAIEAVIVPDPPIIEGK